MGVTGVHPETGLTTDDYEEAAVKRALSRAAAETFVLASAEKLNAASPYEVVGLDEVNRIITARNVEEALVRSYGERSITVVRA